MLWAGFASHYGWVGGGGEHKEVELTYKSNYIGKTVFSCLYCPNKIKSPIGTIFLMSINNISRLLNV